MKRKLLIFGLLATMCTVSLIGCGKKSSDKDEKETTTEEVSTEEKTTEATTEAVTESTTEQEAQETDYSEVYSEVIEQFRNVIYNTDEDYSAGEGENGVAEYVMNFGTESAGYIGYAIEDISGDGIPELVIGLINDVQTGGGYEILAVYTCVDGKPQYVFEGWARSAYFIMADNKLFYSGSGGAMYAIFGIFKLKEDGTELECESYYFTSEKDESYEEIGYYTNTTGEMDKSVSEEISEEDFWNFYAGLEDCFSTIEFTPFSADSESASVDVVWADDVMAQYDDYTEYVADSSEYEAKVAFVAASKVTDFKVLSLELVDFKEDGTIKFDSKEIYSQDELGKDVPLIVTMTFVGEIPNYGISYVDENGETKKYSIGISGYDGLLFLDEITE